MKQYADYKKLCRVFASGILLLVVFSVPYFSSYTFSRAETAAELNSKIDQHNQDISKLEAEIRAYQAQLDTLGKQKSSLNGSLQQLDITRKKLAADIAVTQNKIEATNLKIETLTSDIGTKEDLISDDYRAIAAGVRQTNELELGSLTETILSEDNFSSVWIDIDNTLAANESFRKKVLELQTLKGQLEGTRDDSLAAKKQLISLQSELADQKKIVDQNTADKKKLLAQTQNNEASYQKLVADSVARKTALEKEVGDYESRLKYILDPSKLPKKGVLSWPLATILVTNPFGRNTSGLYASGLHNGVDFRAAVGTPVMAMADGVVSGTGNTDIQCPKASFGNFILVKYDNGLASTYGHLSLIKVTAGQRVARGEIVAYSGNTGYSTGPHLHVSLYPKDAVNVQTLPSKSCPGAVLTQPIAPTTSYLDALDYLPALPK